MTAIDGAIRVFSSLYALFVGLKISGAIKKFYRFLPRRRSGQGHEFPVPSQAVAQGTRKGGDAVKISNIPSTSRKILLLSSIFIFHIPSRQVPVVVGQR